MKFAMAGEVSRMVVLAKEDLMNRSVGQKQVIKPL